MIFIPSPVTVVKLRCCGSVTSMQETKNAHKLYMGNLLESGHLEERNEVDCPHCGGCWENKLWEWEVDEISSRSW